MTEPYPFYHYYIYENPETHEIFEALYDYDGVSVKYINEDGAIPALYKGGHLTPTDMEELVDTPTLIV